jgi:hypothetical protein
MAPAPIINAMTKLHSLRTEHGRDRSRGYSSGLRLDHVLGSAKPAFSLTLSSQTLPPTANRAARYSDAKKNNGLFRY